MNKVWITILLVVVAVATYVGFGKLKDKGLQVYAGNAMEELQAEARRKYPNLPLSDAMKKIGEERAREVLNADDGPESKNFRGAQMFFGYYFVNTDARVAYCRERGVEITPFVSRFEANNRADLTLARGILAKRGMELDDILPILRPTLNAAAEQDMKDVAAGAGVPTEQACALFNEHAVQLADYIKLPPDIRAAMTAK